MKAQSGCHLPSITQVEWLSQSPGSHLLGPVSQVHEGPVRGGGPGPALCTPAQRPDELSTATSRQHSRSISLLGPAAPLWRQRHATGSRVKWHREPSPEATPPPQGGNCLLPQSPTVRPRILCLVHTWGGRARLHTSLHAGVCSGTTPRSPNVGKRPRTGR